MDSTGHILTEFDVALEQLKSNTIAMATLTQKNVKNAFSGLTQRDQSVCNQVIADDEEIDQLEIQIDNDSLQIMAKFQPFASDLRLVLSSMKISHSLERISDHAVSIAKRARKIIKHHEIDETSFIEPAYTHSILMLNTAIQSYNKGSTKKALEVIDMVGDFKKFHKSAAKAYTKKLEEGCNHYKIYLNLVFITRWIERIGGLSINIAEDVIFLESAQDIRHGGELEN